MFDDIEVKQVVFLSFDKESGYYSTNDDRDDTQNDYSFSRWFFFFIIFW